MSSQDPDSGGARRRSAGSSARSHSPSPHHALHNRYSYTPASRHKAKAASTLKGSKGSKSSRGLRGLPRGKSDTNLYQYGNGRAPRPAQTHRRPQSGPSSRRVSSSGREEMKVLSPTGAAIAAPLSPTWSEDELPAIPGCIFPMGRVESRVWELRCTPKQQRRLKMKHFSTGHVSDLRDYSFYESQLVVFKQTEGLELFRVLQKYSRLLDAKRRLLTEEFVSRKHMWGERCALMDKKVAEIHRIEQSLEEQKQLDDNVDQETKKKVDAWRAKEEERKRQEERQQHARRARHHGDSVRSEAEFQEILASFEKERDNDPLVRAQYGAATIPNMELDPVERYGQMRYMDTNDRVQDKQQWAQRLETDRVDTFTAAEHEQFCRLFAQHPKRFGRIAHHMDTLRTPQDCVLHYYLTKKTVDYKQIVSAKNRRGKRRSKKRDKQSSRSSAGEESSTPTAKSSEVSSPLNRRKPSKRLLASKTYERRSAMTSEASDGDTTAENSTSRIVVKTVDEADTEPDSEAETETETETQPQPVAKSEEAAEKSLPEKSVKSTLPATSGNASTSGATIESIAASLAYYPKSKVVDPVDPMDSVLQPPPESDMASRLRRSSRGRKRSVEEEPHPDRKKHKTRGHVTSYWSVQETGMFPRLLEQHGSDWESISKTLGSKTASMVRNYYQRELAAHPDWVSLVAAGDARRNSVSQSVLPAQPAFSSVPVHSVVSRTAAAAAAAALTAPVGPRASISAGVAATAIPSYPAPVSNIMKMSAILNGTPASARPPASAPAPPRHHKPTIMSLLNTDSAPPPPATAPRQSSQSYPSIRPTIGNMINSAPGPSPAVVRPILNSTSPVVPVAPVAPVNIGMGVGLGMEYRPQLTPYYPTQGTMGSRYVVQPQQQQPQQLQQHPQQPQQVRQTRSAGFSALDALAQIAFERK